MVTASVAFLGPTKQGQSDLRDRATLNRSGCKGRKDTNVLISALQGNKRHALCIASLDIDKQTVCEITA
jgi:hypothetical protein